MVLNFVRALYPLEELRICLNVMEKETCKMDNIIYSNIIFDNPVALMYHPFTSVFNEARTIRPASENIHTTGTNMDPENGK
jgi:hypothetical protein